MQADITSNANAVAADLAAAGMKAGAASVGVVRIHTMLLLANVKRRASLPRTGPPGPRIQTGGYVRSMTSTMGFSAGGPVGTAGTNHAAARRLELGFVGVDSLGRNVNAPPYPHWEPALSEIEPLFVSAMGKLADL